MHECLNIIITNSKKGAGTVLKFAKVLAWHFTRFPRNCLYKDYKSFVDTFFFDFFIDKCAVLKWRIQLLSLVYHTSQGKAFEIMSSLNVTLTLFHSSVNPEFIEPPKAHPMINHNVNQGSNIEIPV